MTSLVSFSHGEQNVPKPNDLNYHLPTDDGDVRLLLRSLGEPITLFGEDKLDRRSRLIQLISSNKELYDQIVNGDDSGIPMDGVEQQGEQEVEDDEEYYEPVSEDAAKCDQLYDLRVNITKFSLLMSKTITDKQYYDYKSFDMVEELKTRRERYSKLSQTELVGSKMISDRPVSQVQYDEQGGKIVTASWNGELKVWLNDEDLTELKCFKQDDKISKISLNSKDGTIITGDFDGSIHIYNEILKDSNMDSDDYGNMSLVKLHDLRITDVKRHPFIDNLLITSSFDKTFKLFDLSTSQTIYQQSNAHHKEIFSIGFNPQGSLLSTCGLDGVVRIWDLRSGKVVIDLVGHQSGVYSNAWHPNGHQLITGSNDCTVKVWDLRKPQASVVNLPQHSKLVSDVKISPDGKWFASAGYDNKIQISSFDNFKILKTLRGHDDKIITLDINTQDQLISSGWDHSLKIWG